MLNRNNKGKMAKNGLALWISDSSLIMMSTYCTDDELIKQVWKDESVCGKANKQ
jgi:hypothetical protein